jgi:hypothetical protein
MRKVQVLTSLVAALAMLSAPVFADTLFASDPPDVQLAPGATADNSFDLNDFFDSSAGAVSYTAAGGSVSGSMASVFGLSNPGVTTASFTGTDGSASLTVSSDVYVSNFALGNAPAVDNNNRLAGVAGGNTFYNGLVPGSSISSSMAISGLPAGGGGTPGGVTGGGVTGAAALIATIASVDVVTNEVTGLRSRVVNGSIATGAGSASQGNGVSATINADGSYSITAGAGISGAQIVTLGARSGDSVDAFHVLAAKATDIAPASLTGLSGETLTNGALTVAAGQATLLIGPAVATTPDTTVVLNYTLSTTAGATLAVVGFDGALDGSTVSFSNATGAQLQAGAVKSLVVSMTSGGSVVPGLQLANGGSAPITVTVNRLAVVDAGPVTDYAVNVNGKALANDLSTAAGMLPDIAASGAAPAVVDAANNFASAAGSGSWALNGAAGVANGSLQATLPAGTVTAEAYVQGGGAGTFAMVITTPGQNSITAFKPGASLPSAGWEKVSVSGNLSQAAASFITVQAAGFNAKVDDLSVRVVKDAANHFDSALLGGL